MKVIPVLMAGGLGARLWPLSRPEKPKPFLSLYSDRSMLQETLCRFHGQGNQYDPPRIISNKLHEAMVRAQSLDFGVETFMFESGPCGTAMAVALAALQALTQDPEALLLILPCDHYIENPKRLHKAVAHAVPCAAQGKMVLFGIPPCAPQTAYGYIERGEVLSNNLYTVRRFHEKPDAARAKAFVEGKDHFWNSGMVLFRAHGVWGEIRTHAPDIAAQAQVLWDGRIVGHDSLHFLPAKSAQEAAPLSFDVAVLEKSDSVVMSVCEDLGWDDLGDWEGIWRHLESSSKGVIIKERLLRAAREFSPDFKGPPEKRD